MNDRASFLTVSSVTAGHSGNYTCTAKNKAGFVSYSTILNVNGIMYFILSVFNYETILLLFNLKFRLQCGFSQFPSFDI